MKNIRLFSGVIVLLFAANAVLAQNSILSSGNWYKIAVENTGIHQITYEDLESYGIDPSQVNPKLIRLYGNGNGMLPEDNDEFRYDDLQENSIFVYGEDDEIFDPDDYILFYGESPTEWNLNTESGLFEHEVNLYTDYTYYFIATDLGEGKRIETQFSSIIPPTYTSTSFNDYIYHEMELENLIHSGKKWYGERFEETTEYTFPIIFPNLIITSAINLHVSAAARSEVSSLMVISIDNEPIDTLTFFPVNFSNINSDYAKNKELTTWFNVNDPDFEFKFNYNQPNDSAVAWLDYFTLNAKRNNIFETGQMKFIDIESAEPGKVTLFQITSTNDVSIWNISDPLNPTSIDYFYSNGSVEFTLETDSLLEFTVFDESQFYTPQFENTVANQNLHAIEPPDMVIITHEDFLSEVQQLAEFR